MPPLAVGAIAPDFDLPAVTGTDKHRFRLSDLKGKKKENLQTFVPKLELSRKKRIAAPYAEMQAVGQSKAAEVS